MFYCKHLPLFTNIPTLLSFIVIETGSINQIDQSGGSIGVLDVSGSQVICSFSSVDTPASLLLGHLSADSQTLLLSPVTKRQPLPPCVPSLQKYIFDLTAEIKDSVSK